MTITGFRSIPQSEHSEYAYLENKFGVFARFYGPEANRNMNLFIYGFEMLSALEQVIGAEFEVAPLNPWPEESYLREIVRKVRETV